MGICCCRCGQNEEFQDKSSSTRFVEQQAVTIKTDPEESEKSEKIVVLERDELKIADDNLSNFVNIKSSPSQMKLQEVTRIYKIPDKKFYSKEEVIEDRGYKLGKEIGKGSFAKVYLAKTIKTGKGVACKIIQLGEESDKKRKEHLEDTKMELFILEKVRHPHIIHLFDHFMINNEFYFIMQYAAGGTLTKYLAKKGPFSEEECRVKFAQILSAIRFMHKLGIAHRDLKCENVLLDKKSNLLVSDFGLSTVSFRTSKGGIQKDKIYVGTVPYMSPEIVKNKIFDKKYREQYDPFLVDVWALGVILYALLFRKHPFDSNDLNKMYISQLNKEFRRSGKPLDKEPSDEVVSLIKQILEADINKRLGIEEVAENPWIKSELSKIKEPKRSGRVKSKKVKSKKSKKQKKIT